MQSKEEKIIKASENFLESVEDDTYKSAYSKLLESYKKLDKQTKKIIKMGDSFQNQTIAANEDLITDKKIRSKNIIESKKKILEKNKEIAMAHLMTIEELKNKIAYYEKELEKSNEQVKTEGSIKKSTVASEEICISSILEIEIERAKKYDHSLVLVSAEIDRYDYIKEYFVLSELIELLKEVKNIYKENMDIFDIVTQSTDGIYHLIFSDVSLSNMKEFIESLREEIDRKLKEKLNVKISLSYGITELYFDDTSDDMLKRSSDALLKAKKNGRNGVIIQ